MEIEEREKTGRFLQFVGASCQLKYNCGEAGTKSFCFEYSAFCPKYFVLTQRLNLLKLLMTSRGGRE